MWKFWAYVAWILSEYLIYAILWSNACFQLEFECCIHPIIDRGPKFYIRKISNSRLRISFYLSTDVVAAVPTLQ